MRTVVLVVGALSSVAAVHAQVEARGEHFTVVGKGIDERTAKQALAAVEPVWPLVCEAFGVRRARPKEPLRVYLYRALADYVAADRERTGGRFAPNQAMSHWDSKTAHVAMQPPCADAWLERHGLPLQTQAMLAWEASHLARFELCRNFRSHPGWFYDGLAASVAERTLRERLPELGVAPFFEQKWRRVQRLLRNDELPAVSDLLGEGASDLDMRDRYAARIAFYRYAEEHAAKALRRVARAVRTTGGGSGYAAAVRKVAERQLGRLDRGFRDYVRGKRTTWDEPLRSLWVVGDDWWQAAFPDSNAVAFHGAPVAGGAFVARGAVHVLAGPSQQLNLLFARGERGFYSLAITAGYGVTLFEHTYEGNQWRVLGRGEHPTLAGDVDVPFVVRGDGRALAVEIDGQSFRFDLPRRLPDEIVWGVGAQAGAAGIWKGVRVGPPGK